MFELLKIYLVVFGNFIMEKIIIFDYWDCWKIMEFGMIVISMIFGLVGILFDICDTCE